MPCDLHTLYGPLAAQLPCAEGDPFAIDETILPIPPSELSTDRMWIRPGYGINMPGCREEVVDVVADRSLFRQLGLLMLAVVFHESCNRVTVHTTVADSRVKHLVIEEKHWAKTEVSGFRLQPWVLGYVPDLETNVLQRHDMMWGEPLLRLTNLEDRQRSESDWQNRDTLWIGPCLATGEVAEFFLNAGRDSSEHGLFVIPPNRSYFAAGVHLWTSEAWQRVQQRLQDETQAQ